MARFLVNGQCHILFVPTIANPAAPTVAELTAGDDLTSSIDVSKVTGFTFKDNPIATPIASSKFVPQIPGTLTSDGSSLSFYESDVDADNTYRDTLTFGATGYIVIQRGKLSTAALAAADKVDVWPVQVSSVVEPFDGSGASQTVVSFTATNPPSQHVAIAA